jgi:hypothetical protein
MNRVRPELLWHRLVRTARASRTTPEPGLDSAPPWFAQRVVHRWLSATPTPGLSAWDRAARQGLAFACLIMIASVLMHARPLASSPPWELLTTESVLSSVLPR